MNFLCITFACAVCGGQFDGSGGEDKFFTLPLGRHKFPYFN
jgi:hypothetical protein